MTKKDLGEKVEKDVVQVLKERILLIAKTFDEILPSLEELMEKGKQLSQSVKTIREFSQDLKRLGKEDLGMDDVAIRVLLDLPEVIPPEKLQSKTLLKRVTGTVSPYTLRSELESLKLSTRTLNCLKNGGIGTFQELLDRSEDELRRTKNIGKATFREIVTALGAADIQIT